MTFSATEKLCAVLTHDAAQNIRHDVLYVSPAFYAELEEEARRMWVFSVVDVDVSNPLYFYGPFGPVRIVPKR